MNLLTLVRGDCIHPCNPFFEKEIVFAGVIGEREKVNATLLLISLGANIKTTLSYKTNIVIVGKKLDPFFLNQIIEFLDNGCNMRLMNETIFNRETAPYITY